MEILCVLHADFESAGTIENWAQEKQHNLSFLKTYSGQKPPKNIDFDFLIVMGGPQSPLEIEKTPYLHDEIALIKKAVDADKIILGFCLGAQLIGEALGSKAERSPEKEVGVYPIELTEAGKHDPLLASLGNSFPAIHWHKDMPGETKNSTLLAYSQGCPRQMIRYGEKIYGFQCHLEITKDGIQRMIDAIPGDLSDSKYTQSKEELLSHDYSSIHKTMHGILDRLTT